MALPRAILWSISLFHSFLFIASAQEVKDTTGVTLDEFEVVQQGRSAITMRDDGSLAIKSSEVVKLNRKMGEPDIITALLSEVGINKGSDYSSGISIEGSSPAQTQYLIDGSPVIFPFRFGGIFSTFQTFHFSGAELFRFSSTDRLPDLGGVIDFHPAIQFSGKAKGEANVGILASSLSACIPIKNHFFIAASGRISYIDEIYGKLLKGKNSHMGYKFYDANLTMAYDAGRCGIFSLSAYKNADRLSYEDSHYALDMSMPWENSLLNFGWRNNRTNHFEAAIFYSDFSNTLHLSMPNTFIQAPSSLWMSGARFNIDFYPETDRRFHHSSGFNFTFFHTVPQWAQLTTDLESIEGLNSRKSQRIPASGYNINVYEKASVALIKEALILMPAVRLGWLSSKSYGENSIYNLIIDPQLSLRWHSRIGTLTAAAVASSQILHLIGFSELGLSSDFRIPVSNKAPMERSLTFSLRWNRNFVNIGLKTDATIFFSNVKNQTEFKAQVLEIIDTEYNPLNHLIIADGYNYGFYVALRKDFGRLTGTASYEYSAGRRHNKGDKSSHWRSLYDLGSILKINVTYRLSKHWTLATDFSYASGRVYTPVKALYAIGGNLAMEYGRRNSARLPSYQRLDIGATYQFSTRGKFPLTHILNLTLINAYGHRNVEMQYFILDSEDGRYKLNKFSSMYRFMPSLSYTIQF